MRQTIHRATVSLSIFPALVFSLALLVSCSADQKESRIDSQSSDVVKAGGGVDDDTVDESGVDGSGIDGSGVDGSGVDGSGVDGSGIDGGADTGVDGTDTNTDGGGSDEGGTDVGIDDGEDPVDDAKEFGIVYPEYIYKNHLIEETDTTRRETNSEATVKTSDDEIRIDSKLQKTTVNSNGQSEANLEFYHLYNRLSKTDVIDAGAAYSRAFIFTDGLSYEAKNKNDKVDCTYSKPMPLLPFPAPKARYEDLVKTEGKYDAKLTCSQTYVDQNGDSVTSIPLEADLVCTTSATETSVATTEVTIRCEASEDSQETVRGGIFRRTNIFKEAKFEIDTIDRLIRKITYSRFSSSDAIDTHKICEEIKGNNAEKFECN